MPTFLEGGTFIGSFALTGSNSTATYIEDGVTFTFTLVNGPAAVVAVSNGYLDVATNISGTTVVTVLLTISDGMGNVSFDPSVVFGFSTIEDGQAIIGTPSNTAAVATPSNASSTVTVPSAVNQIAFAFDGDFGRVSLTSIQTPSLSCFTAGTAIATPDGPRAVEALAAGDMVRTADGRAAKIKWLGVQPVDTRLMHPGMVNPIRITAGALGGGLPERDLRLSQDHAIALGGHLINAGALVNGQTIYQEQGKLPDFTYYHIELEAHDLLVAEGIAAETFIDYAGRDMFENGGESRASITEMDLPRISTPRLVPEHIRAALAPKIAAE